MDVNTLVAESRATITKTDLSVLLKVLDTVPIKRVLEIGTDQGFSIELWQKAFKPDVAVTVELYDKPRFVANNRPVVEHEGIHYLWGCDSMQYSTVEKVKAISPEYDFVFIDGDHSYKAAKMDWEWYGGLCKKGGVVVFHDISVYHYELVVRPLWDQLKDQYSHVEIRTSISDSTGIGMLWK